MAKINPFIRVNDGKAREAIKFYEDIFGGKLDMMTVGESPMAKDFPKERQEYLMHAVLTKGEWSLVVMDMMRDKAVIGDNVGVSIECESEKELRDIFSKLEKGGEVFMAPDKQFWGGVFGVVTDQYGVEWMLNFQAEPMKK